jgi:hypothetical protein
MQSQRTGDTADRPGMVFRIILHDTPVIDLSVRHWTEAPECPNANEIGTSVDEVVERSKQIIRDWWQRRTGESADHLEFVLLQGN